jgi:hypothetical protein
LLVYIHIVHSVLYEILALVDVFNVTIGM